MLVRQASLRRPRNPPNSFPPIFLPPLDLSWLSFRCPSHLKSITYSLFCQNTRGMGTLECGVLCILSLEGPPLSQLPPHYPTLNGAPSSHPALSVLFSTTYKSLPKHHRFLSPVFSSTYKTLFPQILSFHIYTNPPGVTPPPAKTHQTFFKQTGVSLLSNGDPHPPSRIGRATASAGQRADSGPH